MVTFPTRPLHGLLCVAALGVKAVPDSNYHAPQDAAATCQAIAEAISSASQVYYPGSTNYDADIAHWAFSSTQNSACSVEPGTAEDVGKILQIVGAARTPFAVKGGGHNPNPGFSSTTGVQIAMTRFNQVVNNVATGTVDVGAGLTWDDVYDELDGSGVNVVGGRVTGVGVAGFTLGGGYSWKTSQYGLTIDNIVAFELVLPNGSVRTITDADKDLWFGLRGGGNNFGIVTKFTLKSHPQTDVWGGLLVYPSDQIDALIEAIANFQDSVNDTKAAVIPALAASDPSAVTLAALVFYDAPTPPAGIWDDFLAIETLQSTVETQSFASFLTALPNAAKGPTGRGLSSCVSVLKYTPALSQVIYNETVFWAGKLAALDNTSSVGYNIEPFSPDLFSFGTDSAYPPSRAQPLLPTNMGFSWTNPALDSQFHAAIKQTTETIKAAAIRDGQDVADVSIYENYALYDTPLSEIYGDNVARLKAIKATVDPQNVMGLAGGFKF
ncbi:FAD-binding domain-containing protein [Auriscalpium vulgare]|uniref:FAD-binding domain-containing protein n=1 Tax=Auriscalpium vulgare TaxID=40419 RepID=A0ACB8RXY3_9AGAM|nr:FAD-binding domain-containing protein [Auriscalpium vulgare]